MSSEVTALASGLPEPVAHILVVEDSVALRYTLAEWLRKLKYIVHEAATADEATTVLASAISVDLVITDVQMPGTMDGFGLVDYIREKIPAMPIIVVSGDTARREINEKDVIFYKKPYDFVAVCSRVADLLKADTTGTENA